MKRPVPRYDEHLASTIRSESSKLAKPTYGILFSYDRYENTATIGVTGQGSHNITNMLRKVPCPITMGVQTVDPEPGRPVWVEFKDGNPTAPMVVAYLNHNHLRYDWPVKHYAGTGIPKYLVSL